MQLTLGPRQARTLSAQTLESGGSDLVGKLGDGKGKWQLFVRTERLLHVMSLLQSPTGHLSNLSAPAQLIFHFGRADKTTQGDFELFPAASRPHWQGFARIINRSDRTGDVMIRAIDDAGRHFGPIELAVGAQATAHFNSADSRVGETGEGAVRRIGRRCGRLALASFEQARHRTLVVHSYR